VREMEILKVFLKEKNKLYKYSTQVLEYNDS